MQAAYLLTVECRHPSYLLSAGHALRGLLRRYPDFPDMRAALAAAEWGAGLGAKAEADWVRV